jgi:hypothetical protein
MYFLFIFINLFSSYYMPENHVCISLGANCISASIIRDLKLNDMAFPLNWVITPSKSLLNLFINDFRNYFEKANLILGGPGAPSFIGVFDSLYDIHSRHDFKEGVDFLSQYDDIKKKYDRRVERLYKLMNSDKKIYFLRFSDLTKKQASDLINIISKKFPKLSFEIIYISIDIKDKKPWDLDLVKNYFIKDEEKYDQNPYIQCFLDAGLILPKI